MSRAVYISLTCSICLLWIVGCSPFSISGQSGPALEVPAQFHQDNLPPQESVAYSGNRWWSKFGDNDLNTLIDTSISSNYSLQAMWKRLEATRALARVAAGERYPQINLSAGAARSRFDPGVADSGGGALTNTDAAIYQNQLFVQSGLSFELDLWRRISSTVNAQELRIDAAVADYENSSQLLAGTVTEIWFRACQQRALLKLLNQQIETSQTLLELTRLRFSAGRGNAIDVLQQQQQLAALQVELPVVEGDYQTLLNQLAILGGIAPGESVSGIKPRGRFPDLPEFPALVRPVDLLKLRPDLRKLSFQLQAAEYDIATAVAERFPRLAVGLSYEFSTQKITDLFTNELGKVFSDIALPLVDGGGRRARVDLRKAEYEVLVADFAQQFLDALRDVEDSVVFERSQKDLLQRLEHQTDLARRTLKESQIRYANGLSDYVPVVLAIQSVQGLERRVLLEKRQLLIARSRLYRALGDRDIEVKSAGADGTTLLAKPQSLENT